jgi:hypothetical protein
MCWRRSPRHDGSCQSFPERASRQGVTGQEAEVSRRLTVRRRSFRS